jgi:LPXTG-motif cell wall-anchored protein
MENTPPPQHIEITTLVSWINTPMVVALFFGLAGAVFIGILVLRRRRKAAENS